MGDDFSELMSLATDLDDAPHTLPKFLRKAVEVTARHVKDDAVKTVRSRKELGHAASAIDYELAGKSGVVSSMSAEVGYNKDRPAGRLGNLVEFGAPSSSNRLSPSHDLGNALLNNESDFEAGVSKAVDDALREVGL